MLRRLRASELMQRSPLDLDHPQAGGNQAIDHAQQSGLAGSGQPHHHKDLTGINGQGDVLHGNPGLRGLTKLYR